ncbi:TIR domain-containing protein [Vibrio diabolicus]|uniref:TIR domain-containing protein n=1 Tax=Vibrio harveyi group TaxID=717610 RepID=UPI0006A79118|nr:TIR domain-containing protein [Vibrio alginolyticus]HAS3030280.1 TIR domain-containing protein [Vibrio parahaemolyticus]HAS3035562.1 TIR domain-containing protein [Vibrio parahaemolyticus]HAS3040952.1 TIR domain-containing protein [Vibrio parahaemolyticus]HAS3046290.1 TIR domain-containing protein [Vibrio parahaemolyticus]HAS3057021.1 TIR domain-containing protein [Vibrio parahaemolyticus]
MSKTYRLFISHSWSYGKNYDQVVELIKNQGLSFSDHSVPKGNPIHTSGTDKELRDAIDAKMKGTSCVLILAGVYSSYSKWIKKEIEIAQSYGKTIIAIEPWDSQRTSKVVKDAAHRIVKWQGKSIVDAIKELG